MTMEEGVKHIPIHTCVSDEVQKIAIQSSTTTEQTCLIVAKKLGIGPVARHLFALRLHGSKIWFSPSNRLFEYSDSNAYDFRLRYKVPSLSRLRKVDIKAYDYYFHQARSDVKNDCIPDISYDKHKWELLGLGVADMYRVMLEDGVERDIVENDYKKYIPKEVLKHHSFFIKKPIRNSLGKLKLDGKHDTLYVKGEYLKQFENMAPNYLSEEYKALTDEAGCVRTIILRVNPFHEQYPGLSYRYDGKKEYNHLCTIDELCYISLRNDGTVEISRKNGIPSYLKFSSIPLMFSFVSMLDGYYRLMVKWTFNLCKDVPTPSLQRLYTLKCHGPVGGEFSYAKLEEKRNSAPGCFILRESETKYNTYYLDVCTKLSSKPKTYKIDELGDEEFLFSGDEKCYKSFAELVATYRADSDNIVLQECLPASEYDKSLLLLCELECNVLAHVAAGNVVAGVLSGNPQCIDVRNLQVYKNQKKEGREGMCFVYRSIWNVARGKKVESAMKILKQECRDKHLKEFLELASRWAFLQSTAVVKLYGVTLCSPFAMVMEYLSLGPLDEYLRSNKSDMKQVDLVEAGTYLATALWHLVQHHPPCNEYLPRRSRVSQPSRNELSSLQIITYLTHCGLSLGRAEYFLIQMVPEADSG